MVIRELNSKMESSKCFYVSATVVLVVILPLFHCQENDIGRLNGNVVLGSETPTLKSLVDPNANLTEAIYNLLPPIEDELHKLSKEEFKLFLKNLVTRLKNDYDKLLEIYNTVEKELEEEKGYPANSTLIKRVKRTHHKGCFSCGGYGGGGYGGGYGMVIPVVTYPKYHGGGGCGGGCGYQRQPYCNTCGGYGGGGYGGGGSFSQSSAQASSSSSSFGKR